MAGPPVRRPRVVFVYQKPMSWVVRDMRMLEEFADVRAVRYEGVRQLPQLFREIADADLVFAWFAKLHALFALSFSRLLRRPFVVVAGGDDAAWVAEINYGMRDHWYKRWCPWIVFRFADRVLAVSEATRKEVMRHFAPEGSNLARLYHGFETVPDGSAGGPRRDLVVMVSRVDEEYVGRKRLDVYVSSARHLPEARFVLVGRGDPAVLERLREEAPENVEFIDYLTDEQLRSLLAQAKVYVQISRHEGFGCAMAEATLLGCIPVVSRAGAIPEVVGQIGIFVDDFTPREVARAVREALALPDAAHEAASRWIAASFPIENRARGLREAVAGLLPDSAMIGPGSADVLP